jgi:hypothetical protein
MLNVERYTLTTKSSLQVKTKVTMDASGVR